jgi:hypothetical protein
VYAARPAPVTVHTIGLTNGVRTRGAWMRGRRRAGIRQALFANATACEQNRRNQIRIIWPVDSTDALFRSGPCRRRQETLRKGSGAERQHAPAGKVAIRNIRWSQSASWLALHHLNHFRFQRRPVNPALEHQSSQAGFFARQPNRMSYLSFSAMLRCSLRWGSVFGAQLLSSGLSPLLA